ncbi:hypothetical protein KAU43_07755 [candidate division WOR-3 bacterium]|nr:hypothetical protein [candidate division WOR-3 bacterium]
MKGTGKGWKGESRRHSLSRKGIKTNIDKTKRLSVRNFVARGEQKELKSEYYNDGFDAGQNSAMFNLEDDREELIQKYKDDELGEVIGHLREHQVQMAGDISYDVMYDEEDTPTSTRWIKPSEYAEWEEGYDAGYIETIRNAYLGDNIRGVYDNGGKSADRYSVIFKNGDLVGMSDKPFHPQGFNQFSGNVDNWDLTTLDHLGKRLVFSDIPDDIKDAIEQRLGD